MIDTRVGSVELEQLAESLAPPARLGPYTLEGLLARTSTALVVVARGGIFGDREGVLKLTGKQYAPLLDRELGLLRACHEAQVNGIVRPALDELHWMTFDDAHEPTVAALLLPFLAGGDLAQLIGAHATRTGRLGSGLALRIGEHVATILRDLLRLPKPLVHRDVKPQNLLLPYPGAARSELTLIDFDVADQLDITLDEVANAPRDVGESLLQDVHAFGVLLYNVATGSEPPLEGAPSPHSGNSAFDTLVQRCLLSELDGQGYLCLADNRLWHDLEHALEVERTLKAPKAPPPRFLRALLTRPSLAGVGALLFIGLVVAVVTKVSF